MKTKISLLVLFIAFSVSTAFAHALWIETSSTGQKGQPQEVKIFFGEYESKAPDTAAKWFSNLKDFKILVTAPNGKSQFLTTTEKTLFYTGTFTPDQDGVYKLSVVHEVAAVFEHAKIEYYAFADVAVGSGKKVAGFPSGATLTLQPEKNAAKASETTYIALWNKAAFAKQKIAIVNPDGSKQNPETDEKGKFVANTTQKGNYFIEAFTEDKKPGKLNGKDYEKVWYLATYFAEVK
ncbi:DUF4198 domain-containing protein [Pedobacter sp. AW1-32]|uniref:DUF4198 domain-containing protein n=1 Tax=Pedobacter sp. AW1-32 TaxID=3383026 RepID=UPI003FF120EE